MLKFIYNWALLAAEEQFWSLKWMEGIRILNGFTAVTAEPEQV